MVGATTRNGNCGCPGDDDFGQADEQFAVVPVTDDPLNVAFDVFAEQSDDLGVQAAIHAAKGVGRRDQAVGFLVGEVVTDDLNIGQAVKVGVPGFDDGQGVIA